jgi:hypothetical protein
MQNIHKWGNLWLRYLKAASFSIAAMSNLAMHNYKEMT